MRAMFLLIDCKDYMEANKQTMVRSTSALHWAMTDLDLSSTSSKQVLKKVLFDNYIHLLFKYTVNIA